jgi:2-polyprenyl-3-methyl-5-hydroxy-6-metoxy-1,4-benzoquinol methylase
MENPRQEITVHLLRPGKKLLDIGCWEGRLLSDIDQAGLFEELYGIDISSEVVEKVISKGFNAEVVDLNDETLPFPDEFFDAVIILAVLEHVFDPYRTYAKLSG